MPEMGAVSQERTEWNMSQYDFARFHEMLLAINNMSARLEMRDNDAIEPLFALLRELYVSMARPILFPIVRKRLDDDFEELRAELNRFIIIREYSGDIFNIKLAKRLRDMEMELFQLRQVLGMGTHTYRPMSSEERLKAALSMK